MFSSLTLGSLIYILDKSNGIDFHTGKVISISAPKTIYGGNFPQEAIDLKVNVDGNIFDYNQIPSVNSYVTYNNNKISISETKLGLQSEVESLLLNSKDILENIDKYELNVKDCENILKLLNPQFAKDKERDDRLDSLESKFMGVEDKIDKILTFIEKTK